MIINNQNNTAMEKYSKSATAAEEAVNTKITKIELEIGPALYEDAPKKTKTKRNSLRNLDGKSPKNLISEEDGAQEKTLEKL